MTGRITGDAAQMGNGLANACQTRGSHRRSLTSASITTRDKRQRFPLPPRERGFGAAGFQSARTRGQKIVGAQDLPKLVGTYMGMERILFRCRSRCTKERERKISNSFL
jgi:hypothetical protein